MVEVVVKSPVTLPNGGQDDGHDKEAILNHSGFDTDNTVDSKAQAEQSNSGALVMIAGCNGVRTYNGFDLRPHIFIAHTCALKSRGLMIAYAPSPYTITTWITSYMTTAFLKGPGFRWGYGVFCIITPAFMLPLFDLFMYYYCKAKRMELVPKRESNREWRGPIYHYAREFDAVVLLLITADIALVLLPFNIYSYQKGRCKAHIILYSFIFGSLLIITFALSEKSFALIKFLPYHLLTIHTIIGSPILIGAVFVVNDLPIVEQTWMNSIYNTGSCLWSINIPISLTILGVSLMLKFRTVNTNVGYLIMCQILIASAGGTLVICEQIAAISLVGHQFVVVLAI
ncbi:hypothetical protein CEP52_009621 [Fusarium oligoseptatum]|uniref:Uncharacterized protein n=1 Tax=Fusarium oligoseptatum TaxID=2604345 RepID=A0A428TCC6_9HYPO|nr:hypothetical protein CEP52_009621 [Fusarium oligoseptatum]